MRQKLRQQRRRATAWASEAPHVGETREIHESCVPSWGSHFGAAENSGTFRNFPETGQKIGRAGLFVFSGKRQKIERAMTRGSETHAEKDGGIGVQAVSRG